jgi:uncharacterized beta-barrel protein YwiB (DUF1934 family)
MLKCKTWAFFYGEKLAINKITIFEDEFAVLAIYLYNIEVNIVKDVLVMNTTTSKGKPIKLKVVTEMRNGAKKETLTQQAEGVYFTKNKATYFLYEERHDGNVSVKTTVKVKEEHVTVIRTGAVQMKQHFIKNEETASIYRSVHGPMEMVTKTDTVQYNWNENKASGKLSFSYILTLQGEQVGRHKLTYMIEEV